MSFTIGIFNLETYFRFIEDSQMEKYSSWVSFEILFWLKNSLSGSKELKSYYLREISTLKLIFTWQFWFIHFKIWLKQCKCVILVTFKLITRFLLPSCFKIVRKYSFSNLMMLSIQTRSTSKLLISPSFWNSLVIEAQLLRRNSLDCLLTL
jgi:hypothetical protein